MSGTTISRRKALALAAGAAGAVAGVKTDDRAGLHPGSKNYASESSSGTRVRAHNASLLPWPPGEGTTRSGN